eukprot:CAMPEP_0170058670 /NCGR_PEP_ID=MMETSP0019_2-20121128/1207_1 /TAXON_ID=98059 /ORGANISM="Dinobryon sp., Strain UTEXLB2267" /LENGTH=372 /DNA_ID=CAMNT_0010263671 /DNA_START=397 /DNA_END=1515 /DNA_ORIENTATION=-
MHNKALKGETTENKYMIDLPVRSGSADNLLGFISMFMWALLSDRVFIKYQSYRLPMIELAYEPATFNWLAQHNPIETRAQCVTYVHENQSHLNTPCDTTPMKVLNTDTRESRPFTYVAFAFSDDFYREDLRKIPSDGYENELLLPISSRGYMYQMFNNPHHNETLKSWGLKQETIFGCFFHYLLRPRDAVCKNDLKGCVLAEAAMLKARSTPNTILISVQIRLGGGEMEFECVDQLVTQYKAQGKAVVYVLMTSNANVQAMYKQKYGDSLILPSWTPSTVVDFHHAGDHDNKFSMAKKKRANLDLARDIYINSLADVHVITYSGLGSMTGALRPRDKYFIYRVDINNATYHRKCNIDEPDSMDSISTQHSGL